MLHVGDNVIQCAGSQHNIQIVCRVTDAVIRQAILRIIVGAYFFLASAGSDESAALCGVISLSLLLFHFKESGAENAHARFLVFKLGAPILAAHHDTGRQVENLNGGFCSVNVLTTGTTGAAGFDT